MHSYVAHEPDPQAKATAAKCLQAFLTLQHQKMSQGGQQQGGGYGGPQQQPQVGGMSGGPGGSNGIAQILNTLGGGQ